MGAVTSIFYSSIDYSIAGLVLDSPFASLKQVALHLAKTQTSAPTFLLKWVLSLVRKTIKEKAHFDLKVLKMIPIAKKCLMPAFFITARGDDFVLPHETFKVYS